jgi:dethiobiotin synthetase
MTVELSIVDDGPGWFITGTDTGVGKTHLACRMLDQLRGRGAAAAGFKPVASGAEPDAQGRLVNADALALRARSTHPLDYAVHNPYCFSPAIAPHLAAAGFGVHIERALLRDCHARLQARHDCVLVEGAGGWLTPIGAEHTLADVATDLGLPVILVVGLRLGCINHALLTAAAIQASGLPLAAWVGNCLDPAMDALEDNLHSLRHRLPAPCWGILPWSPDPSTPAGISK